MTNQNDVMQTLNCNVNGQAFTYTGTSNDMTIATYNPTLWNFWQYDYYPHIIKESYPVYIQEKAMDKGKQAFELLKALMDKNLVKVDKVKDFIEAMDTILKTL
jgi:hypothetical protein